MLEQNISTVNNDVKTLVKDAQALFTAATALTGEKAEELRGRGMRALDTALRRLSESEALIRVLGEPPGRLALVRAKFGLSPTKTDTAHPTLEEFVARFTALHEGRMAPLDDRTRFAWIAAWTLLRWRPARRPLERLCEL